MFDPKMLSILGAFYTDFTMIRASSLHRANGGYLVLPVEVNVSTRS